MLLAVSCVSLQEELPPQKEFPDVPVKVGFGIGSGVKTIAGEDGLSTSWEIGDKVALWAFNSQSQAVLDAKAFDTYSADNEYAFFTATLPSAMPEGRYTYYISYPEPVAHTGTQAEFEIPTIQDGVCGGGADILVSIPVEWNELKAIDYMNYDHSEMTTSMAHLTHRFRFYTEASTELHGESISKIITEFPKTVAGRVSCNVANVAAGLSALGNDKTIKIIPDSPVEISSEGDRHYAMISTLPFEADASDVVNVKLYTSNYIAWADIPLDGRIFAAGHTTPVKIVPSRVAPYYIINVNVNSNNLGEKVESVTLTAPSGCNWADNGGNVFVYAPEGGIDAGSSFSIEFEDENAFRTFSGKTINVTYESEHVSIGETVTMPSIATSQNKVNLALNVPYLLYEDFASVGSFSSNDAYATSSTGSYSYGPFLNGWTGGRIGAEAGHSIRVAAHQETGLFISVSYPARVDSAPIKGTLKKAANLSVEFDYGANIEFLNSAADLPQNCYIGYVTSTTAYKSAETTGTFQHTMTVQEYDGTYTNLPNHGEFVLTNVPVTSVIRISIRTELQTKSYLGTNATAWLYIDNFKVKISK